METALCDNRGMLIGQSLEIHRYLGPHMAISFAEERPWSCVQCGAESVELTWLAVDIVERPDLRGVIADGSWLWSHCSECEAVKHRVHPLLITRLSDAAPVVLAVTQDVVDAGTIPEDARPILDRVRATFGDKLRDIPGPLLLVPFESVVVASSRDIDADTALSQASGDHLRELPADAREAYSLLLNKISRTATDRRLALAMNRLWDVGSLAELKQLTAEFPELASPGAQEESARQLDQAVDEEERRVATSRLDLVTAIAAGDLDDGWAAYETSLQRLFDESISPRIAGLWQELQIRRDAEDHASVVMIGNEIRAIAIQGGFSDMEADVSMAIAHALLETPGDGRSQRIEEAIALMHQVLAILDDDPELNKPELRAETLANLGAAYGTRLQHDPAANMERQSDVCAKHLSWSPWSVTEISGRWLKRISV